MYSIARAGISSGVGACSEVRLRRVLVERE
jgi:hypothetical protein